MNPQINTIHNSNQTMPHSNQIEYSNPHLQKDIHDLELSDDGRTLTYVTEESNEIVEVLHKFKYVREGPKTVKRFGEDVTIPAATGQIQEVDITGEPRVIIQDQDGETHVHIYTRWKTRPV